MTEEDHSFVGAVRQLFLSRRNEAGGCRVERDEAG